MQVEDDCTDIDDRAIQLPMATDAPHESTPILTAQQKKEEKSAKKVNDHGKYKVYPGRFYVLIAFALLAGQQALSWMTFGTIPNESYRHFGLTDDAVTLLSGAEFISIKCMPISFYSPCSASRLSSCMRIAMWKRSAYKRFIIKKPYK